jgi:hypothetical protein
MRSKKIPNLKMKKDFFISYILCYPSGFKKEKRRGDFFNYFFHLKMLFND